MSTLNGNKTYYNVDTLNLLIYGDDDDDDDDDNDDEVFLRNGWSTKYI